MRTLRISVINWPNFIISQDIKKSVFSNSCWDTWLWNAVTALCQNEFDVPWTFGALLKCSFNLVLPFSYPIIQSFNSVMCFFKWDLCFFNLVIHSFNLVMRSINAVMRSILKMHSSNVSFIPALYMHSLNAFLMYVVYMCSLYALFLYALYVHSLYSLCTCTCNFIVAYNLSIFYLQSHAKVNDRIKWNSSSTFIYATYAI